MLQRDIASRQYKRCKYDGRISSSLRSIQIGVFTWHAVEGVALS